MYYVRVIIESEGRKIPINISELDESPVITSLIDKLEKGKCYTINELFEINYDRPISFDIMDKGDTQEERWARYVINLSIQSIDMTSLYTTLSFEFEKGHITKGTKNGQTYFCKK